jgi:hypothetical protein
MRESQKSKATITPLHRKKKYTTQENEKSGKDEGKLNIRLFYRMPESFKAFCNIVSFTAANTSRIFVVSVACVKCG